MMRDYIIINSDLLKNLNMIANIIDKMKSFGKSSKDSDFRKLKFPNLQKLNVFQNLFYTMLLVISFCW
jgi:hypothetical protein